MKQITAYSFGASTAEGSMDTEGGFIARLGHYLNDTGAGEAINHGVGGDTTTMMLARLDGVVSDMSRRSSESTPLALVTLGINDVPRIVDDAPGKRVALDQHAESLQQILSALKKIGDVLYLTQYPVAYEKRSLDPALVESYVKKGAEVAHSVGVEVIDIFSAVTPPLFAEFIYEDGLHFNNRGHQFIANKVIAALHSGNRI